MKFHQQEPNRRKEELSSGGLGVVPVDSCDCNGVFVVDDDCNSS